MRTSRVLIALFLILGMTPAVSAAAPKCTTGELFAGAPDYKDPRDRAKDGQGLLDVPPLGFRTLLFADDKLVTAVGQELWFADLSAASLTLTRFVGREALSARESKPGKCRDARFGNISGLARQPDGSLVGTDQMANTLFVVTDPFGPACAVAFIAGATGAQSPLNPGSPASEGDADGPGAKALLRSPDWLTVLGDGTVYFVDTDNGKLKTMLPDSAHTVQTVAKLPEGATYALIALNGKLYTVGNNDSSEGYILEIDPASGDIRDVLRGRSDAWQSDGAINLSGLATDGAGFFTTQSGQVLYVTLKGEVENIAGNATYVDFRSDYDPKVPHPAAELELLAARRTPTAGANVFLAYRDGQLYLSAAGTTPYVERIACK